MLSNNQPALPAGTQLDRGRYRIEKRAVVSYMADMYHAVDTRFRRPVTIKMLNEFSSVDERKAAEAWFSNEAALLSKLDHPDLATFHTVS